MSFQRQTKFIDGEFHYWCTNGRHFAPKEDFHKRTASRCGIASTCKTHWYKLMKTKYRESQSRRDSAWHIRRKNLMLKVKEVERILKEEAYNNDEKVKLIHEVMKGVAA